MAITIINLESAITAFDALCGQFMEDTDVDDLAPAIVAKYFDRYIDDVLEQWMYVPQEDLEDTLTRLKQDPEDETPVPEVHDLLYEVSQSFGYLGLIVRVVLLDRLGNLLIQTEEIDDDTHRLNRDTKNGIVQHPRYGYFGN